MKSKLINSDLQKERSKCTFNIEELTNILDRGHTQDRRALEDILFSIEGLNENVPEEFLSHKEKFENTIRKEGLVYHEITKRGLRDSIFVPGIKSFFRNPVTSVFRDGSPFMVHYSMFIPTINGLGDDEQREYWGRRAYNTEILGTYVQTEIGHGTFLRGLETEATYDEQTEEFVIHSPSQSAYKWWPGGLGHVANYCIVMAQLKIKGISYGMQPFLVQIRDEETHMPLPGIKVGEIGPKLGFNSANNGFLGFNHVRVPRRHMLMRFAQVTKNGQFIAKAKNVMAYGTMVMVRVTIVSSSATHLSRAVTIAMRYSAVRHQSELKANEPEPQILDYVTQQHKLFVALATSHAYIFVFYWLWDIYSKYIDEQAAGNFSRLPELHALACCLKVLSSSDCTALIERCRLSCGGHGYMMSSGLPYLYGLCTASCTYEGENTVLLLQTARSLVKAWDQITQGQQLAPTMSYLADNSPTSKWDSSLDGIVKAFQRVSKGKLSSAVSSFQEYKANGSSSEDAWNKSSVQLTAASEAFGRAVVLSAYKSEMERLSQEMSSQLKTVLFELLELYFTNMCLEKTGDLLLYTQLSGKDIKELQKRYEELLELIRPNAVGLVDAFDYRDEILNSTLGSYDDNAYERLMAEALKSPLNAEPVNHTYHKYLKPLMKGKL